MIINLTSDQIRLLKEHGTVLNPGTPETYYYLPFWFRSKGDQWEIVSFDQLSKEVTDFIKSQRDEKE